MTSSIAVINPVWLTFGMERNAPAFDASKPSSLTQLERTIHRLEDKLSVMPLIQICRFAFQFATENERIGAMRAVFSTFCKLVSVPALVENASGIVINPCDARTRHG